MDSLYIPILISYKIIYYIQNQIIIQSNPFPRFNNFSLHPVDNRQLGSNRLHSPRDSSERSLLGNQSQSMFECEPHQRNHLSHPSHNLEEYHCSLLHTLFHLPLFPFVFLPSLSFQSRPGNLHSSCSDFWKTEAPKN